MVSRTRAHLLGIALGLAFLAVPGPARAPCAGASIAIDPTQAAWTVGVANASSSLAFSIAIQPCPLGSSHDLFLLLSRPGAPVPDWLRVADLELHVGSGDARGEPPREVPGGLAMKIHMDRNASLAGGFLLVADPARALPGAYEISVAATLGEEHCGPSCTAGSSGSRVKLRVGTNEPPFVQFDLNARDLEVFLDSSASRDPDGAFVVRPLIEWGDGTEENVASARHVYAAPGTYTIRVSYSDAEGARASAERVLEMPAPSAARTPAPATLGRPFDAPAPAVEGEPRATQAPSAATAVAVAAIAHAWRGAGARSRDDV